jgi:hypothetical protein
MSQKINIADALDAIERNVVAFLKAAGLRPMRVTCQVDGNSGTASIRHDTIGRDINVTMYLPAMPAQTMLTTVELDRWTGYFVHELAHAFYTDEQGWKDAVAEGVHVMVNALEDVRIERKLNDAGIIGNSRGVLNALLAYVVDQLPAAYDPNDLRNLPWLFAMTGRLIVCGYEIPAARAHADRMSPAMAALVDDVMAKVAVAQNTFDILVIARDLVTRFKNRLGNKPGNKPGQGDQGQGDQSDQGEQGQGEPETGQGAQGDGETAGDSDQGETPAGEAPTAEQGQGDQGERGDGKAGEGGKGGGSDKPLPAGDFDPATMREVDLKPETAETKRKAREHARGNGYEHAAIIEGVRDAQRKAGRKLRDGQIVNSGVNDYLARLNAQAMKCGTLRQQVARVLRAEETETWTRGKAAGRIDRFALGRMSLGAVDGIYCKREIAGGYETEIGVLVDGSASMAGGPAWAAAVLAYVIAQAAAQVGVKSEVAQFPGMSAAKHPAGSPGDRNVQKAFAGMGVRTGGSTPLTQSIVTMAARLAHRAPGKRKVLFAVTDGGCDSGPSGIALACAYAERLGVETVALCIDMDTTGHSGFKHAVSCDAKNIAAAGLGKLVQVLSRD